MLHPVGLLCKRWFSFPLSCILIIFLISTVDFLTFLSHLNESCLLQVLCTDVLLIHFHFCSLFFCSSFLWKQRTRLMFFLVDNRNPNLIYCFSLLLEHKSEYPADHKAIHPKCVKVHAALIQKLLHKACLNNRQISIALEGHLSLLKPINAYRRAHVLLQFHFLFRVSKMTELSTTISSQ